MKRYFSLVLLASNALFAQQLSLEKSINDAKEIVSIIQAGLEEEYELDKFVLPELIDALTAVASHDNQPKIELPVAYTVIKTILDRHGLSDQWVTDAYGSTPAIGYILLSNVGDAMLQTTIPTDLLGAVKDGRVTQAKEALQNNPEAVFQKDDAGKTAYEHILQSDWPGQPHKKAIIDALLNASLHNANNECPVCLSTGEEIKQDHTNDFDVANPNCMHFICKSCKKELAQTQVHANCPLCDKQLK